MAIFEEEDETIRQKGLELIEIVPSECTSFEDKDIEYRDIEYFLELYRKNKKPSPIWVREFENTYQVIDGHHRYTALKELGYNKIPVTVINYFSNHIITDEKDSLSKNKIIENSLNGNLFEPKTTKHLVYCNKNKSWFPVTLLSSLYLLKSIKN